ncbi:MAG: hypothetical protein JO044_14810 [Mycobacteriaceae bacterium]|nr:hypothetical protein [Mycobacteriaceae bacterium]
MWRNDFCRLPGAADHIRRQRPDIADGDADPVLVLVEGRTAVIGSADLDTAAFQMGG